MASPRPQITVLVPCFDDAATLGDALASIAAQTFGDFEVVISDDASRDASPAIAEGWAARDSRFRLLLNPANLGMTENWNRALAAGCGEFAAKLDADDLWRPRTLERLRAEFERTPDLLASFCRVEVQDGAASSCELWPGERALATIGCPPGEHRVERGRRFWLGSLADAQLWHSNAFLVRRHDLVRLGGFDARWSCASDTALFLRLLAEDRPVAHVPYAGVVYRRREGSVSARSEAAGWKALEGQLVRLDALRRSAHRLGPLPRAARQSWWQAWRDARRLAAETSLWVGMSERLRCKLERAATAIAPPPRLVRLEGWLRLGAWRLRRLLSGSRADWSVG